MGSDGHEEGMEAVVLGCELRMVGVRVAVGMKYINLGPLNVHVYAAHVVSLSSVTALYIKIVIIIIIIIKMQRASSSYII